MNPKYLKHDLDYMYDHVYIIYVFVKFLDEPPAIICMSCHPGNMYWFRVENTKGRFTLWTMKSSHGRLSDVIGR
jgi:hypothetical protein